jgi:hypothetical protein
MPRLYQHDVVRVEAGTRHRTADVQRSVELLEVGPWLKRGPKNVHLSCRTIAVQPTRAPREDNASQRSHGNG